jgi:hypothetical protein
MPYAKGDPHSGTQPIDIAGQRFGLLTVQRRADRPDSTRAWWHCLCDCGQPTVTMGKYLRCGDTRSCGCLQTQYRSCGNYKHGGAVQGLSREYRCWRDMKERCSNPNKRNYRWYGALGVTVCDRWRKNFPAFLADMGPCPPKHSLDRIDPFGNYEPDNCRWADWTTQCANKRKARLLAPAFVASSDAPPG